MLVYLSVNFSLICLVIGITVGYFFKVNPRLYIVLDIISLGAGRMMAKEWFRGCLVFLSGWFMKVASDFLLELLNLGLIGEIAGVIAYLVFVVNMAFFQFNEVEIKNPADKQSNESKETSNNIATSNSFSSGLASSIYLNSSREDDNKHIMIQNELEEKLRYKAESTILEEEEREQNRDQEEDEEIEKRRQEEEWIEDMNTARDIFISDMEEFNRENDYL